MIGDDLSLGRGGFLRLFVSGDDGWWTRPYGYYVDGL